MSKKLICLFLSLLMLLSVCLTACGKKDDEKAKNDIGKEASQSAITLAMYLMSEKPVDADTVAEIEEAVNKITENKFKTRLKLYYYTEAEYYTKLEAAFAERDERKANGTLVSSKQESETGEDETFVNEYGIVEIKYPSITGYQVDIFYFGGKDKFMQYKEDGRLTRLDDEIKTSEITSYIAPQYLSDGVKKLNKGTYAIPTSKPIGEYTYLLLNKKAMTDAYLRSDTGSTTYTEYTSLTCDMVKDFLHLVDTDTALSGSYYPLYTNLDSIDLLMTNLKYWGVDDDGKLSEAFSVLGGYYNNNDEYLDANKYARLENLFANEKFINDIKTLKQYEFNNYYAAEEGKDFAVGYVSGGREIIDMYGEDYEIIPVEYPRLTEEELYSDMFGVCSYTANLGRSMKILTLLNTDADFRNLVLYGIEGKHYLLHDKKVMNDKGEEVTALDEYGQPIQYVERLEVGESKYLMDVNKTGNTLIVYPLGEKNIAFINNGIVQNREAKISLDLGYTLDANGFKVDVESLKEISALSAQILTELKACKTMEELNAFIESARARIEASEAVKHHASCSLGETAHEIDGTVKGSEESCDSFCCSYEGWLKKNEIIK